MNRRTLLGVVTISAMAFVLGATGLTWRALAQGPGGAETFGPGMHGAGGPAMMKRMISARLDQALDQANVTADQRAAIHASRDRAFAALDALRPDPRAHRDQMLALFEADRIDPAQLETLHEQMEQRHQAVRAAITQAIVEIHDTLTPEQRHAIAQYVRSRGPVGMR